MVNQQLRIDPEELIKTFLAKGPGVQGHPGNIAHGENPLLFQLPGNAAPHPPEIRQRPVIPQLPAVGHLVQAGNSRPLGIRRNPLGHNVHSHLAQVQVGPHPRRGRNPCLVIDLLHEHFCKAPGIHAIKLQIGSGIDEDLVDGIGVNVLRSHVLQVDAVNPGAARHIVAHSGGRHDIAQLPVRVTLQVLALQRLPCEFSDPIPVRPQGVHLLHPLHNLEKPCSSGDAIDLQRRGNRQTDGLLRSGGVRHHQMGGHRVQPPLHAFHRCIEGF